MHLVRFSLQRQLFIQFTNVIATITHMYNIITNGTKKPMVRDGCGITYTAYTIEYHRRSTKIARNRFTASPGIGLVSMYRNITSTMGTIFSRSLRCARRTRSTFSLVVASRLSTRASSGLVNACDANGLHVF